MKDAKETKNSCNICISSTQVGWVRSSGGMAKVSEGSRAKCAIEVIGVMVHIALGFHSRVSILVNLPPQEKNGRQCCTMLHVPWSYRRAAQYKAEQQEGIV